MRILCRRWCTENLLRLCGDWSEGLYWVTVLPTSESSFILLWSGRPLPIYYTQSTGESQVSSELCVSSQSRCPSILGFLYCRFPDANKILTWNEVLEVKFGVRLYFACQFLKFLFLRISILSRITVCPAVDSGNEPH